jgi:hypothetical protein
MSLYAIMVLILILWDDGVIFLDANGLNVSMWMIGMDFFTLNLQQHLDLCSNVTNKLIDAAVFI